jgi:hypothetical protein
MKTAKKAALVLAATGVAVGASTGAAFAGGDGGASANAIAAHSPGVLSGNVIQVPIEVPVNVCGNTINVIGLINPAFGNRCANISGGERGGGYFHHSRGISRRSGFGVGGAGVR